MDAKDAIRSSANVSMMVLKSYISDLEDSELLKRPTKGCNHIAYQLGHLIASEVQMLEMVAPGQGVELPEGFAEAHSKEKAGDDNLAHFHDKATYLDLFDNVREATFAALGRLLGTGPRQGSSGRNAEFLPDNGATCSR